MLEMIVFEHIENSEARGASNRIAAERAEKFHAIVEAGGDFRSGDDGSEREGISDGLAEHHDVGDDVLRFESPEVRAEAAEADLHFVGDADATGRADVLVGFGEIAGRKNNLAGDAGERFGDVRGDSAAFGRLIHA